MIAIIYEQHDLLPAVRVKFCDTLSFNIIDDINPGVRKKTLQFWKNVIQRQLIVEGMIDGAFPEVTFSKESKRIVVLNNCEIKKRLVKILNVLSSSGCLSVLKIASQDPDKEVSKIARDIITDFNKILEKYNVEIFDVATYTRNKCERQCFEENPFLENNISFKLKGRLILSPELFLDYMKDYLKPIEPTTEISQNCSVETILSEILFGDICQNYSFDDNNMVC